MSALAKYCVAVGMRVSGSDIHESAVTEELARMGVRIYIGHARLNARGAKVVVYTSAVKDDNPELCFARDNKKTIYKRSELLARIERMHKYSIAVSGCHGKTTVTAMLAHIFMACGADLTAFIGGCDGVYGNFIAGGGGLFLSEACEFRKNFLDLSPKLALVLNIDNDHLDCYRNMDNLVAAYKKFVSGCVAVINADDSRAMSVAGQSAVTYAIKEPAVYKATDICETDGGVSFSFSEYGAVTAKVKLALGGRYNVYNALAALSAARCYGADAKTAAAALETFGGVSRRQEKLAEIGGTSFIADYAHHPSELAAVLSDRKNALAVFQPHTYSRTKLLSADFVNVLKGVKTVIMPTYAAREPYDPEGGGYTLFKKIKDAGGDTVYAENKPNLFSILEASIGKYKEVILLGAGDIYQTATEFVQKPR